MQIKWNHNNRNNTWSAITKSLGSLDKANHVHFTCTSPDFVSSSGNHYKSIWNWLNYMGSVSDSCLQLQKASSFATSIKQNKWDVQWWLENIKCVDLHVNNTACEQKDNRQTFTPNVYCATKSYTKNNIISPGQQILQKQ